MWERGCDQGKDVYKRQLVDGGVAVRVELHGLAHDVGALLALALEQAHLVHGVQPVSYTHLVKEELRK